MKIVQKCLILIIADAKTNVKRKSKRTTVKILAMRKNLAKNLANKNACEYIVLEDLELLLHSKDIKIAGITDENLSKAILTEAKI